MKMRTWLVTARDNNDTFIDQRRIEAPYQEQGMKDAYSWIKSKGGNPDKSTIREIYQ